MFCTESVPNTTISDQPFAKFVKHSVLGLMDASQGTGAVKCFPMPIKTEPSLNLTAG